VSGGERERVRATWRERETKKERAQPSLYRKILLVVYREVDFLFSPILRPVTMVFKKQSE